MQIGVLSLQPPPSVLSFAWFPISLSSCLSLSHTHMYTQKLENLNLLIKIYPLMPLYKLVKSIKGRIYDDPWAILIKI